MNEEKKYQLVEMLTSKILTPLVYYIQNENVIQFFCFCDGDITYSEIFNAEWVLMTMTDYKIEIIDFREFDEIERFQILKEAEMVYCADPTIQQLFEWSMMNDATMVLTQKQQLLDRIKDCETAFLN